MNSHISVRSHANGPITELVKEKDTLLKEVRYMVRPRVDRGSKWERLASRLLGATSKNINCMT